MSISKLIRTQGKNALNNNWTSALLALFVLLSFFFVILALSTALVYTFTALEIGEETASVIITYVNMLSIFALSPVFNGYLRYHYKLSDTKNPDISDVFYFFKKGRYFKTIGFNMLTYLRMFLHLLPAYGAALLLLPIITAQNNIVLSAVAIGIIITAAVICFAFFAVKYSVTMFVYANNPDEGVNNCFRIGKAINKRHFYDNFRLFMSFVPWILSCYFVITGLYVIPYYTTSIATSAKWLIKLYKDGKIV